MALGRVSDWERSKRPMVVVRGRWESYGSRAVFVRQSFCSRFAVVSQSLQLLWVTIVSRFARHGLSTVSEEQAG